jgi:hypothetical protein
MKTSNTWIFRSIMGKIMMGLILAAMIGSINVVPARGQDGHKNMGKHDNGRSEHRGRGYDHDRNYRSYDYYGYGRRDYYPPPPVVYVEPPEPGISIFFPPVIIR